MHTMIHPTGVIVINHIVFSLSAGEQRLWADCPFMCLCSLYAVRLTLCTIHRVLPPRAPASVWTGSRCCLCSNPFTPSLPARSSPPTSVFNQLVPFISGNIGAKRVWLREFDSQPRFFFLKPDITSRPTTTPRAACFQVTIESPPKPGAGILDHRNPFQPLASTDQALDEKW